MVNKTISALSISLLILVLAAAAACGSADDSTPAASQTGSTETESDSDVPAVSEGGGVFVVSGELTDRRKDHSVLILQDGTLMVAGGRSSGGGQRVPRLKSAEIYDPATEQWKYLALMVNADLGREHPAATVLSDGKVLVTGGANSSNDPQKTTEIYDPAADTWTAGPKLKVWRWKHTQTLLPDGRVLIVGGTDDLSQLTKVSVYDPETNEITSVAELAEGRSNHVAILLNDGRVLVAGGGKREIEDAITSSEIYDPATDTWTFAGRLSEPRLFPVYTMLSDGKVMVVGGKGKLKGADIFDPTSDTWSTTCPMSTGRSDFAGSTLADGRVVVGGGEGNLDSTEIYNPWTGIWSPGPRMNLPRNRHRQTTLPNGRALITGGQGPDKIAVMTEYYEPGPFQTPSGPTVLGCGGGPIDPGDALVVEDEGFERTGSADRTLDADTVDFADPVVAGPDDDVLVTPLGTPATFRIGQGVASPGPVVGTLIRFLEVLDSPDGGEAIRINLRGGGWDLGNMDLEIPAGSTEPALKAFGKAWVGFFGFSTDAAGEVMATLVVFEP
jgi:N-acetylneuraminic acid mutarotase